MFIVLKVELLKKLNQLFQETDLLLVSPEIIYLILLPRGYSQLVLLLWETLYQKLNHNTPTHKKQVWSYNTVGKTSAFHVDDLGLIPRQTLEHCQE